MEGSDIFRTESYVLERPQYQHLSGGQDPNQEFYPSLPPYFPRKYGGT
jgi:hypothetical protein